jgi:predicted phosphodiesterase
MIIGMFLTSYDLVGFDSNLQPWQIPEDYFDFVVISDTHFYKGCIDPENNCYSIPLQIREQINNLSMRPEFVVNCGDLICNNSAETCDSIGLYNDGFEMPVYMVIGNHEADPDLSDTSWVDDENHVKPVQGLLPGSERWYHWTHENSVFVVVNNNNDASDFGYETSSPPYDSLHHYFSSQRDSVRKWLDEGGEEIKWKFVFGHRAYYGAESKVRRPNIHFSESYAETLRTGSNSFLRDLEAYEVDFMISGDQHAYCRTTHIFEDAVDEFGPIYMTVGGGGGDINRGIDTSLSRGVRKAFDDKHFYTIFKVRGNRIRAVTIDPESRQILDEFEVFQ